MNSNYWQRRSLTVWHEIWIELWRFSITKRLTVVDKDHPNYVLKLSLIVRTTDHKDSVRQNCNDNVFHILKIISLFILFILVTTELNGLK